MRQYYIYDGQVKKGPFDLEHLKLQPLDGETPVWYEGLKDWTMAGDIDELKGFFISKTPPPPPLPRPPIQKNIPSRIEILNSFEDAQEIFPETRRRGLLMPILISIIIIAGIIVALFLYR
jgi:GYF domain 2